RETPELEEVRSAVERMIQDGIRGGEVIARIRALMKKEPPARQRLDINEVVRETATLAPIPREGSNLRIELASDLAHIVADRVAVQQVLLNLIGNAVDAMKPITDRSRELS